MEFENENNEWGQYIFLSDEENNLENKYTKIKQYHNINSRKKYNMEYLNDPDYYNSYDSILSYDSIIDKKNRADLVKINNNDKIDRHPILFFITCIFGFYNYFLK